MSPAAKSRTFAFERVAVVNRGEPAMRLINAVREWNAEGRPALRVIAVYTAADRQATFVRQADEAVLIGPDDAGAAFEGSPYLDYAELERALRACRADAVWPGWGFVVGEGGVRRAVRAAGHHVHRPVGRGDASARRQDRVQAAGRAGRRAARAVERRPGGRPGRGPRGGRLDRLPADGQGHRGRWRARHPVRAVRGGPGRGLRAGRSEAAKTAGDATVFLERAIRGGRHVEVQVVADAAGTVWALGVRDCSVQRRNQKVLEESASTALDEEQEKLLRAHAAELVRAAGYVNAGTVEFLYEPGAETAVVPGGQHPAAGRAPGHRGHHGHRHRQAAAAHRGGRHAGGDRARPSRRARGHAIEARLTAEDPERGFAPAPGLIEHLALPSGPGIRVDTGVAAGDVIPPQFDSMIAKVIAWGQDRAEARARLARALRQTRTVIRGGTTSKAFLLDLLSRPEFVRGEVDTTWLDTMMADGYAPPLRVDVALLATAFEAYEAHERRQQDRLFTSAERGRPEVGHELRHQADVRVGGEAYRLRVSRSRLVRFQVELDGRAVEVDVERSGRFELRLTTGGQAFDVLSVAQGPDYLVEVDGAVHRISGGEAGLVRAPAPAMVVAITVTAGDEVAEGDVVAVVESMKLETSLRSPATGRVAEVFADVNTQVESGAKLLRIEPAADEADAAAEAADDRERADLGALAAAAAADGDPARTPPTPWRRCVPWCSASTSTSPRPRRQLRQLAAARDALPADDPRLLADEAGILRIFADVSALWRSRRVPGESQAEDEAAVDAEAARNPQEYMHAYLRSRDADAEGLPESFRIRLRRTLAHYGVDGLEPSAELDPALYRIFLAHRRAAAYVPVVSELLRWRLSHPESLASGALADEVRDGYRRMIDQLVSATQLRHPGVGELARQVRYRCFDEPLIAAERARAQQEVRAELDRLSPDPAARAAQIDAIVASGEPILGVFTERHDPVMLEVMTRRYYWIRPLRNVQVSERSGRPLVTAEYSHDGHDYLIIATRGRRRRERGRDRPPPADPGATARPDRAHRPVRHLADVAGRGQRRPRGPHGAYPRQARGHPARGRAGGSRGAPPGRRRGRLAGLVHLRGRARRDGGGGPDPARLASAGGRTAGRVAAVPVRAGPAARRPGRAPVPDPGPRGAR